MSIETERTHDDEIFAEWDHEHEWMTVSVEDWDIRWCPLCEAKERRHTPVPKKGK